MMGTLDDTTVDRHGPHSPEHAPSRIRVCVLSPSPDDDDEPTQRQTMLRWPEPPRALSITRAGLTPAVDPAAKRRARFVRLAIGIGIALSEMAMAAGGYVAGSVGQQEQRVAALPLPEAARPPKPEPRVKSFARAPLRPGS
jgi:hypothetical protein